TLDTPVYHHDRHTDRHTCASPNAVAARPRGLVEPRTPELARRFGLSATAVSRHAGAHLPASLARAAEAGQVADSARLLDRVRRIVGDLEDTAAHAPGESRAFRRDAGDVARREGPLSAGRG